jgi:ankyrin repeat protein
MEPRLVVDSCARTQTNVVEDSDGGNIRTGTWMNLTDEEELTLKRWMEERKVEKLYDGVILACKEEGCMDILRLFIKVGTDKWGKQVVGLYPRENEGLCEAFRECHMAIAQLMIEAGGADDDYVGALRHACRRGHLETVKFLIATYFAGFFGLNPDYLNIGLAEACLAGHLKIAQFLIETGANGWDRSLQEACKGGHLQVAQMLIDHESADLNGGLQIDWNSSFVIACEQGHLNFAQLLCEKGATLDWNRALELACRAGHIHVVQWLIEKNSNLDWNRCLRPAIRHRDIVNLMIEKGAANWDEGLRAACEVGSMDVVRLMIEKGATCFDHGMLEACRRGNMEMVQFLIEKGGNKWDTGLAFACSGGYMEIVQLMIEKGATDWNSGLKHACATKRPDIAKLMIEKGANKLPLDFVTNLHELHLFAYDHFVDRSMRRRMLNYKFIRRKVVERNAMLWVFFMNELPLVLIEKILHEYV